MKISEHMLDRYSEDRFYQDKKPKILKFKDNRKESSSNKVREKTVKRVRHASRNDDSSY